MQRVWVVHRGLFEARDSLPENRQAELVYVKNFEELERSVGEDERLVVLAELEGIRKIEENLERKLLAAWLLPERCTQEFLSYSVRAVLQEGRNSHYLEAAEGVAWSGAGGGRFDDPAIEYLGGAVLELSGCRDMDSIQKAVLKACARVVPTAEVEVVAHPDYASNRVMGRYQLAVPVHFQGVLKAHIYVRFQDGELPQAQMEKVSEALLNISDVVALAVERNQMITKAEETKTVWEASFDAVEDPVAILDEDFKIVRANRAYSKFIHTPVSKLQGKDPEVVSIAELMALPRGQNSEWEMSRGDGTHYRVFFDLITEPLGAGRFVLRFHDVTKERTLTEKILAKEQIAEMGILVGSVAHEINNPIGGILAIGQVMISDLPENSPIRADIRNIMESAERCRKIVQTMLTLVRKSDEEKKDIVLAEAVHATLELLQSEATRLQLKLKVEERDGTRELLVHANKNRLMQVFFHLLQQSMNALAERHKQQRGDAYLRVLLIPGHESLEVRIEDNGDPVKHEYEIQSSVAFAVSKMIMEEHGAQYFFVKSESANAQRLIFPALANSVW